MNTDIFMIMYAIGALLAIAILLLIIAAKKSGH